MIRYLLDTNILSEPTRVTPNPGVLARLAEHRDNLATAAIVWHELWYGCRRLPPSRKRRHIESYLLDLAGAELPVLPYTQQAADWHAQQRARLEAQGRTPGFADGQIAAIAKTHDFILVTRNVGDFQDFDVSIESWFID